MILILLLFVSSPFYGALLSPSAGYTEEILKQELLKPILNKPSYTVCDLIRTENLFLDLADIIHGRSSAIAIINESEEDPQCPQFTLDVPILAKALNAAIRGDLRNRQVFSHRIEVWVQLSSLHRLILHNNLLYACKAFCENNQDLAYRVYKDWYAHISPSVHDIFLAYKQ
ncbi:MAG: hypothetical protein OXC30_00675 [Alphaproteobacteria bacterium]|nr:hypothetical protein [Alphaproteobacteria bacterium]